MSVKLNELGESIRQQLAEIVTGGDATIGARTDSFVTWCSPGIPFDPDDFDFAVEGISAAKDAEELRKFLYQAYQFATVVDFIPDASGILPYNRQPAVHRTKQWRLSVLYKEILKGSRVSKTDLSSADKAKLKRWRDELTEYVERRDPVAGVNVKKLEDSALIKQYNQYMADYEIEKESYNNKRIAAMSATGPEGKGAVLDWATNESLYRKKVQRALGQWVSAGYKNEVEELWAAINQMTSRSVKLWKQELLDIYDKSKVSSPDWGLDFLQTVPIPGGFAKARGWDNYSTYDKQVEYYSRHRSTSWSIGGKGRWGLWSFGGGTQNYSSEYSENFSVSTFSLKFGLTQVLVARPWFVPEFFANRAWTLQKGRGWNFDEFPSNGRTPPKGNFVGYPTSVIFARDIEIISRDLVEAYRTYESQHSSSGSVGWGPFSLKGSYSHAKSDKSYSSSISDDRIKVPGMQIIGFINHLIPKSPNPWPDLKPDDFE